MLVVRAVDLGGRWRALSLYAAHACDRRHLPAHPDPSGSVGPICPVHPAAPATATPARRIRRACAAACTHRRARRATNSLAARTFAQRSAGHRDRRGAGPVAPDSPTAARTQPAVRKPVGTPCRKRPDAGQPRLAHDLLRLGLLGHRAPVAARKHEAIDAFASQFVDFRRSRVGRGFAPLRVRLKRPAPSVPDIRANPPGPARIRCSSVRSSGSAARPWKPCSKRPAQGPISEADTEKPRLVSPKQNRWTCRHCLRTARPFCCVLRKTKPALHLLLKEYLLDLNKKSAAS